MRSEELVYQDVNPRKVGELNAFRDRALALSIPHDGLIYTTRSLGDGQEAMVFLPTGMGMGEIWFPQMLHLRATCRTVCISLPECKTLDAAAHGTLNALNELGVERFVLVGCALGGVLAQIIARLAPDRVMGMALCVTGAPSPLLPASAKARWATRRKGSLQMRLSALGGPARLSMAGHAFELNCPAGQERQLDFWRAFIEDVYCNHLYKKQYINLNYIAQPAYYAQAPFSPDDLSAWAGKVLIFPGREDPTYGDEQDALLALYPKAAVQELGPEGQFAMLAHGEELSGALQAFWGACGGMSYEA